MSTGSVAPRVLVGVARREEAASDGAFDDRRVVAVGREHAGGAPVPGVADHGERRARHGRAVDAPFGVEDLVPAMLAVGLREHHHLDVRRVAPQALEDVGEIGDLSLRQREALRRVHACERGLRIRAEHDVPQRSARMRLEQASRLRRIEHQRLGHRVEERRRQRRERLGPERRTRVDAPGLAALDPPHGREAAHARDVGRLRSPRRHRPEARHREEACAFVPGPRPGVGIQQPHDDGLLGRLELTLRVDEVDELDRDRPHARLDAPE